MRVLGIDLGLRRSGLALSDEYGLTVRLLDNLDAKNQQEAIGQIQAIVKNYHVQAIVIGTPEVLSQDSETIARRAASLAQVLKQDRDFQDIDVVLWDESLSSKKAMQNLVQSGVSRKKRAQKLDAAAAAILVEDYLYWRQSNAG